MSVSSDVVIMTRAEFEAVKLAEFHNGCKRGEFEAVFRAKDLPVPSDAVCWAVGTDPTQAMISAMRQEIGPLGDVAGTPITNRELACAFKAAIATAASRK